MKGPRYRHVDSSVDHFALPDNTEVLSLDILARIAADHRKLDVAPIGGVEELGDAAIKLKLQLTVPANEADAIRLAVNFAVREQFKSGGIRFAQETASDANGENERGYEDNRRALI
jgi:hypothetical protein